LHAILACFARYAWPTTAVVLARELGNENLYEWPGPIAWFLLGKRPAGVLEVAAEPD
jgi:hypothetical protein